jgi:putative tricarboxylic transport membrane protein
MPSSPVRLRPALALALLLLLACGAAAQAQPPYQTLRLIAPAAPGGGWDQTARAMQQVLQRIGAARVVTVENVSGAAGTIGLARFIGAERGRGDVLLVSGLIMLAAIVTHQSPVTLADTTPVARLIGEYEVIVVPAASPFRSLRDLVDAFRARPESVAWGGGSAGGTDQVLAGLIADAVGVAPRRVNYVAFSGGGDMLAALLGRQLAVGVNGFGEMQAQIEAGGLRVLGVSSAERVAGIDAPTLREQGVDVELVNWRSVVAPPAVSDDDRRRLVDTVQAMVRSPEWREVLARYRWIDSFLAGPELDAFVAAEETRVRAILQQLGTSSGATATTAVATGYPLLVLAGLLVTGLAAAGVFRGSRAASAPAPTMSRERLRTAALLGGGLLLHLALLERAGFVIASAVLFWAVARSFDDRHPVRDGVLAVAMAAASYALFARGLQLTLPAGIFGLWP